MKIEIIDPSPLRREPQVGELFRWGGSGSTYLRVDQTKLTAIFQIADNARNMVGVNVATGLFGWGHIAHCEILVPADGSDTFKLKPATL